MDKNNSGRSGEKEMRRKYMNSYTHGPDSRTGRYVVGVIYNDADEDNIAEVHLSRSEAKELHESLRKWLKYDVLEKTVVDPDEVINDVKVELGNKPNNEPSTFQLPFDDLSKLLTEVVTSAANAAANLSDDGGTASMRRMRGRMKQLLSEKRPNVRAGVALKVIESIMGRATRFEGLIQDSMGAGFPQNAEAHREEQDAYLWCALLLWEELAHNEAPMPGSR